MDLSLKTKDFVRQIDEFSQHKLRDQGAIGILVDLAHLKRQEAQLEEIAFLSKFLSNTNGILKRSGPDTEGYEKLTREFQLNLENVIQELKKLIDGAPQATKEAFMSRFLAMTGESFENLMNLLYDLSWLKNWYIDQNSPA